MLDQPSELTINATAFKARCLGLMDDLSRGRLKRVSVTKRGKIVAELKAAPSANPITVIADDGEYPTYWRNMKTSGNAWSDKDWAEIESEIAVLHFDWPDPEYLDHKFQRSLGDRP
jgi:hypothetical protein